MQPERSWEADLEDLERQIDDDTAALLLNNPSNPCGSVYSRQHLLDILALCEKYRLPIISDEIYDGMVTLYCRLAGVPKAYKILQPLFKDTVCVPSVHDFNRNDCQSERW